MQKDTSINNKKQIRIGIDAKWYFSGPSSGRVVVQNLVDNIIELNINNIIVLFVFESDLELITVKFSDKVKLGTVEIIAVKGKFNFLMNMFLIQKIALKNRIEIVLFQNYISLFPSSKVKNVAYVHDLLFLDYPQFFSFGENLLYRMMFFLLPRAHHIITISDSEKVRINKHLNFPDKKISVVRHGVSEKFIRKSDEINTTVREKYNLPDQYVLYIGRINARKNIPVLIKSMLHINIPLVLIGKKEFKSFDLDSLAESYGVKGKLITLGFIPEEDLISILSSSTVFCFPSYVEGFGLPPLEAMKCGIPVVTTSGTSIPEVCGDSVLYFEPENEIQLAELINSIIDNEELRKNLINKGFTQSSNFTWNFSALKLIEILEKI